MADLNLRSEEGHFSAPSELRLSHDQAQLAHNGDRRGMSRTLSARESLGVLIHDITRLSESGNQSYLSKSGNETVVDMRYQKADEKPLLKQNVGRTTAPPKKTRLQQVFTTEDWCSVWVGIFSFTCSCIAWTAGITTIPLPVEWLYNPFDGLAGKDNDYYPVWGSIFTSTLQMVASCLALWNCGSLKGDTGVRDYVLGFYFCYVCSLISFTVGKQATFDEYGIGYAVWSLFLGMFVINVVAPLLPSLGKVLEPISGAGEFFIKIALVNIANDFSVVESIVGSGILTSWPKIPLSLGIGWWLGRHVFKIESKELIILVLTAFTICGTSASAAVGSALMIPKDDVNLVIAICSLITIPFMLIVPYIAKGMDLSDEVAGGWIGTGVDNTGNVVVSGAIFSEDAETIAGITKILQTIALGPTALGIAYFWAVYVEPGKEKPSWWFLYDKFPKFVLGFLFVSFLITFVVKNAISDDSDGEDDSQLDELISVIKGMERWWAIMGFTAIGLKSDLRKISKKVGKGGGLIWLYVVGGTVDIIICLGFSLIWYSGLVFSAPQI